MKRLVFELSFQWDDGPESKTIILTVPESVNEETVKGVLKALHDELCEDADNEDIYGQSGRCPSTLMDYVCSKMAGWSWSEIDFVLNLD